VGSQVPVWIPIVVALVGLAGVILTQVLSGRREARRMAEEAAREERRWQREREARTHETRAEAYARLMGVLEAFDGVLFQAGSGAFSWILQRDRALSRGEESSLLTRRMLRER